MNKDVLAPTYTGTTHAESKETISVLVATHVPQSTSKDAWAPTYTGITHAEFKEATLALVVKLVMGL